MSLLVHDSSHSLTTMSRVTPVMVFILSLLKIVLLLLFFFNLHSSILVPVRGAYILQQQQAINCKFLLFVFISQYGCNHHHRLRSQQRRTEDLMVSAS